MHDQPLSGGTPMTRLLERRAFLGGSVVGLVSGAAFGPRAASGAEISRETLTYKTVGACAIKADILRESAGDRRPVAVWIHGGALIMGDRSGIDRALRDELIKAGFVVVSIDYRPAPGTQVPAILVDVKEAFDLIRAAG